MKYLVAALALSSAAAFAPSPLEVCLKKFYHRWWRDHGHGHGDSLVSGFFIPDETLQSTRMLQVCFT